MSKKLKSINQDLTEIQGSLFAPNSVKFGGLEESGYPELRGDAVGWREVIRRALQSGYIGIDYEFKRFDRPTIMGIAAEDLAVGMQFDRELHRGLVPLMEAGVKFIAHSGYSADSSVYSWAAGFAPVGGETELDVLNRVNWSSWVDSIILHYLVNAHLTKAPEKDESDDSGALGFMDLYTATSLVVDVPNWKVCRRSACNGPCPTHNPFDYCSVDSWGGLMIARHCTEVLKQRGFNFQTFLDRSRLAYELARMQAGGVNADLDYLRKFDEKREAMKEALFPLGEDGEPQPFNPRSSDQVIAWFGKQGLPLKSNQKLYLEKMLETQAARFGYADVDDIEDVNTLPETVKQLYNLVEYKGGGKKSSAWFDAKYFDKAGKLHPRFVYVGTSTGRLSSSRPNCFSPDTEVLTREGWLRFEKAYQTQPEIAAFDPDTGEIRFVQPISWLGAKNDNTLVHLVSEHIDLAVTQDHKCLLQRRRTGKWWFSDAIDYPEDNIQYNAGMYVGGDGVALSDDEIRYLIAVQADGCIYTKRGFVRLTFRKQRKIERLRELLIRLGWFHKEKRFDARDVTDFLVQDERACALVLKYFGDGKIFGSWVLNLSRAQIDVFLGEVYYWDGVASRQNQYASVIKQNVDWVSTLETLSGYRTTAAQCVNSVGCKYYEARRSIKAYSMTTNVQRSPMDCDVVYCCKVPTSAILVRRNGKTCITGQCQNIPSGGWGALIKGTIIPHNPEKEDIIDADLGQLELRSVLFMSGYPIDTIKGDALAKALDEAKEHLKRAADASGRSERDILKTVVYGGQYGEGVQIYTPQDLQSPVTQRQLEKGAIRLYTPEYVKWLDHPWEYAGGVIGFTGANLAERLFGDKKEESRRKALEIQDDIIFAGDLRIIREWQIKVSRQIEVSKFLQLPNTHGLRMLGSPHKNFKVGLAFLGQGFGAMHAQATMLEMIKKSEKNHLPLLQVHDSLVYAVRRDWPDQQVREFMVPFFSETPLIPGFKAPGKVKRGRNYGSWHAEHNPGGLRQIWDSSKEDVWGQKI